MVRRKGIESITDDFMEATFSKMSTLYHLDEISVGDSNPVKLEFDGLPKESIIGISILGSVWMFIGVYFIIDLIKKNKKSK